MTSTISRKDYVADKVSHKDYYGQFVSDQTIALLWSLKDSIMQSKDENLNDIGLHRWDRIAQSNKGVLSIDGVWSLSTAVCILKQSARQIRGF